MVTIIGGDDGVGMSGVADNAVTESIAAAERLVTIGILSAIDGCDRQKFDVRSRDDRTPAAHTVHI
jgi:hypothetical protein